MSLFRGPEEHAANPPETWRVVAVPISPRRFVYDLVTSGGIRLQTCALKRDAVALKTSGFFVNLYEMERRWYAGEPIPNWRPYAECVR